MARMDELMSAGESEAVATWYSSGWKTWWLRRSISVTSTGAALNALAAAMPAKPPPTMKTLGLGSVSMRLPVDFMAICHRFARIAGRSCHRDGFESAGPQSAPLPLIQTIEMFSCGAFSAICWLAMADAPIDFDTQVMPVLSKAGCNAGACHG